MINDFSTTAGNGSNAKFDIYNTYGQQAEVSVKDFFMWLHEVEAFFYDETLNVLAIPDDEVMYNKELDMFVTSKTSCKVYDYDRLAKERGKSLLSWLDSYAVVADIEWVGDEEESWEEEARRDFIRDCGV